MSDVLTKVKSKYGNFWLRFLALFIDYIVLVLPVLMVFAFQRKTVLGDDFEQIQLIIGAITYLLFLLYGSILESSGWQGSIGKKVLNLKVTNLKGDALSFSEALVRNLAKYWTNLITVVIPFVTDIKPSMIGIKDPLASFTGAYMLGGILSFLSVIGFLIAAFTPRRQALHDIVAKTAVLTTKSKSSVSDDEW